MRILSIRVKNFKSFVDLHLQFADLNLFVGANASGKSNFVSIFKFVRNIAQYGLENAISMEGGIEYLRNTTRRAADNLEIHITYVPKRTKFIEMEMNDGSFIGSKIREVEYGFAIKFYKRGLGFRIVEDRLTVRYEFTALGSVEASVEELEALGHGEVVLTVNQNGEIRSDIHLPKTISFPSHNEFMVPPKGTKFKAKMLLLETPFFELAHRYRSPFNKMAIFDFDPKLPRQAASVIGLNELEEHGGNLPIVLKEIEGDKEKKRQFLALLNQLLPFITDFKVQKFADQSILLAVSETYQAQRNSYLPASLVSDGTINLMALLVALYFEEEKFPMILEEPERHIYPHLMAKLMGLFRDVAQHKQLLITTHHPELVKHADLDTLFLVARDAKGFSIIYKPVEIKAVQGFLDSGVGAEELYLQDWLGVGRPN